jgi:hypothetical protein
VLCSLGRTGEARKELTGPGADGATACHGLEANLLVDSTMIGVEWFKGDHEAVLRLADDVRPACGPTTTRPCRHAVT